MVSFTRRHCGRGIHRGIWRACAALLLATGIMAAGASQYARAAAPPAPTSPRIANTPTASPAATPPPLPATRPPVDTQSPTPTPPPLQPSATTPTITSVTPNTGPTAGGTSVAIAGTNFTGATKVTFGGTNASSFTVNSSTKITATTPAKSAGAVTVAVTTSSGTGSKTSGYTYVAPPTVTSVSPNSGPIAGGTSVTITGTNLTAATKVTFDGINASSFTVNSATKITATTPADAVGPADVAVTTAGGTGTLAAGYTYVGTLSITAAPADFSYSATLSGGVLTLTSSFAVGINDSTGSGAGWKLQADIGVLTDGASDTIPASDHTLESVAVTGVTGTAPTNGIAYPLAIPTASATIFNAAANTGTGQATMTFATQLAVPADAAAGTYTATLTITIASGP